MFFFLTFIDTTSLLLFSNLFHTFKTLTFDIFKKNGSLVLALNQQEIEILHDLMKRGETNGVQNLKILSKDELFKMEPAVNPDAIAALYSPDAGNVIPYEYAIALAENAVDNGVELRIRREVVDIAKDGGEFVLHVKHWEPKSYVDSRKTYASKEEGGTSPNGFQKVLHGLVLVSTCVMIAMGAYMAADDKLNPEARQQANIITLVMIVAGFSSLASFVQNFGGVNPGEHLAKMPFEKIVEKFSAPSGSGGAKVTVEEMFVGGSGSPNAVEGVTVGEETVKAKYIINCAGGASDRIARLIGDDSFEIKPRLGDYLLLNRNQGHLTQKTIFPAPDPVLGKGVLVQTTLWVSIQLRVPAVTFEQIQRIRSCSYFFSCSSLMFIVTRVILFSDVSRLSTTIFIIYWFIFLILS